MTEPTAGAAGRSALIFGARNLGRAIIETLVAQGWAVAGAARSDETLAAVTAAGALALRSDITDQAAVRATVEEAVRAHGGVDLVVNAAAAYGGARTGPFGGGPIADAAADAFDSWSVAPARSAFAFLSGAGGAVAALERPVTLVQVTGGSSRRAMPGRGLWAAGAFGVRAITQAASTPGSSPTPAVAVRASTPPCWRTRGRSPTRSYSWQTRDRALRRTSCRSRRWRRPGCRNSWATAVIRAIPSLEARHQLARGGSAARATTRSASS
jgi:NAD(P)-dependent dehydrogenase (short-subunit alcohol dehydrogenase family)